MWELNHKESWVPKNGCFWTVVLEETLESPLDCKEIQPVNPKGNQSWIFIGRPDVEAETPILWPPDAIWLFGKDPDAGRGRRGCIGWGHWVASLTQRTWIWASSGSWWWTGKPGVLQSMGSQRVGHDWVTELNWISPLTVQFQSQVLKPREKTHSGDLSPLSNKLFLDFMTSKMVEEITLHF